MLDGEGDAYHWQRHSSLLSFSYDVKAFRSRHDLADRKNRRWRLLPSLKYAQASHLWTWSAFSEVRREHRRQDRHPSWVNLPSGPPLVLGASIAKRRVSWRTDVDSR